MKKDSKSKQKRYQVSNDETSVVNEPLLAYSTNDVLALNPLLYINQARSGVAKRFLMELAKKCALTLHEVAAILHLSDRTLLRYSDAEKLDTDASSKVLQLAHLYARGERVFGSGDNFGRWLRSNVIALEGKQPLQFLDTPFGFQLIDDLMGRIEHGVYS